MSNEKANLPGAFEELLSKSIEANKVFLSEGAQFFRRMSDPDLRSKNLNLLQGDTMSNAVNEYVKLNLGYINNLVDLGLNFIRQANNNNTGATTNQAETRATDPNEPSFVLEKETEAGQTIQLGFILDNIKSETVTCELINTGYTLQTDKPITQIFKTNFQPQAFDLEAGANQPVNIAISIPTDTAPGLYISKALVKGFEPAHFSIRIIVTETQKKPTTDGGKKAKPKRKQSGK